MMRTLSIERMQLSDDPEDWVWIRWQRCRPGAKAMPWAHFTTFPLWDDCRKIIVPGPQVHFLPSQYRREEVSPFPGLFPHGPKEYWQEGLPLSARGEDDQGELCGAMVWQSEWPVALAFKDVQHQFTGGQTQGGTAVQHGGFPWVATGGQAQGGVADQCGQLGFGGLGGQAQGGEAVCTPGFWQVAQGGQSQGGVALQGGSDYYVATGGQAQGGIAEQGPPCGPVPEFVNCTGGGQEVGGYTADVPLGDDDNDLIIVVARGNADPAVFGFPAEYTLLFTASFPGEMTVVVSYARYGDIVDGTLTIVGSPGIAYGAELIRVHGSGVPIFGEPATDPDNAIITAPAMTVDGCPSLLFMSTAIAVNGENVTNPGGMTFVLSDPETSPICSWFAESPTGDTGDRVALCDDNVLWVAFLWYCPPA